MTILDFLPNGINTVEFWYGYSKTGLVMIVFNVLTCFILKWFDSAGVDVSFFKKCPLDPNPFFPKDRKDVIRFATYYFIAFALLPCVVIAFLKS